jgi:hypothetical protein
MAAVPLPTVRCGQASDHTVECLPWDFHNTGKAGRNRWPSPAILLNTRNADEVFPGNGLTPQRFGLFLKQVLLPRPHPREAKRPDHVATTNGNLPPGPRTSDEFSSPFSSRAPVVNFPPGAMRPSLEPASPPSSISPAASIHSLPDTPGRNSNQRSSKQCEFELGVTLGDT